MAELNQQELVEATRLYTERLEQACYAMNEIMEKHYSMLRAAGLLPEKFAFESNAVTDTQSETEFMLQAEKQAVHGAIRQLAKHGINEKLNKIIEKHNFKAAGDTAETITQKINLCPDWQKVRALLTDLKAELKLYEAPSASR